MFSCFNFSFFSNLYSRRNLKKHCQDIELEAEYEHYKYGRRPFFACLNNSFLIEVEQWELRGKQVFKCIN